MRRRNGKIYGPNMNKNNEYNFSQKDIVKETRKSWFIMNNLMKHIERYIQDYDYIGEPSNSNNHHLILSI